MKKLFLAVFLVFLLSQAQAQKGIVFKIQYQPGHSYQVTGNMTMDFTADLSAIKDIATKLQAQGITQPIDLNMHYATSGTISTGKSAGGWFPVTMGFGEPTINATINGKPVPIPVKNANSTKVYAHVDKTGILNIDSLSGSKMTDSSKMIVQKMMGSFLSLVKFPDHPLKIGDVFTQDIPLNVPVSGKGMAINIKVTYKLVSATGEKAFFDLVQNLDMQLQIKTVNISLTGVGTGKMVYDIKQKFPVSLSSDMDMKINAKIDTMSMSGTAKISSTHNYIIN